MKKVIISLAAVMLLALAALNAPAALTAYEPFNYTTGGFANNTASTGNGFTGNWANGAAGTIVTGLTYPGLTVANNALSSGQRPTNCEPFQPTLQWHEVYQFFIQSFWKHGGEYRRRLLPQR
ncbi:hypothetical protein [Pedosphaera parvula]|uniref:Uncharacterized protein n=1 Tax=Pedosphaera parvula (strain Ellin514) TaxID=320771 RepID=B9XAL0_PEDPL|nr:hypothetical protein [Pedosphaera parvula]EEF63045.1 hypothetical protein Cflav_PD5680 [Pedosphaera parvula Ellin514]